MSLLIPVVGLRNEMVRLTADTLQVGLYGNNHTPALGDVIGTYTPASFGGYSGLQNLAGLTISDDGTTVTVQYNPVTWTCDGSAAGNVYGYYVYDLSNTVLEWAELDPAGPTNMSVNGQTFTVVIKRTHKNQ